MDMDINDNIDKHGKREDHNNSNERSTDDYQYDPQTDIGHIQLIEEETESAVATGSRARSEGGEDQQSTLFLESLQFVISL